MKNKNFIVCLTFLVLLSLWLMLWGSSLGLCQKRVEITYVSGAGGESAKALDEVFSLFEKKHTNLKVNRIYVPTKSWGEFFEKVLVMIAGGEPVDTGWVAIEGNHFVITKNMLTPLESYIERDREELPMEDIHPALIDSLKYKGKVYQIPFDWNNMVLFYNTELYKQAGIKPPSSDWTKDDFLEIAQKLTKDFDGDGKPDQWGFQFTNDYFAGVMPWVFLAGGSVLTDGKGNGQLWTKSRANAPEEVEAIQFLRDLVFKYKVSPRPDPVPGWGTVIAPFVNEKVAMITGGRWPQASLKAAKFANYDVQLLPRWRTQKVQVGVGGWPIFTTSKHPEEVWKLTKFSVSEGAQKIYARTGFTTPSRRSIANSKEFLTPPPENAELYYKTLDNCVYIPSPPQYTEIESILLRFTGLILAGEMDAKDAMDAAHHAISALLKD